MVAHKYFMQEYLLFWNCATEMFTQYKAKEGEKIAILY